MLLRDDLRYIVLDLETTGLDKKNDEIIQIGIVEYSSSGKEVVRFSSYVKPQRDNIQDLINMITGISLDMLEDAPSRERIEPQIQHFLEPNCVIIGHSIGFDIAFLTRYTNKPLNTFATIDTLPLAQALYPYQPSYALEILADAILAIDDEKLANTAFHDALVDVLTTGSLFFSLLQRLESLLYFYPYLREVYKRGEGGLASCLDYKEDQQFLLNEIPQLHTTSPIEKKQTHPLIPEGNRYVGETTLSTLLQNTPIHQYCIAFSHHSKALLAQKTYAKQGVLTPLHEQTLFDMDVLFQFFTKKTYEDREVLCATKYLLHAKEGHSSYHTVNAHDSLFVQACHPTSNTPSRKKIFTHHDLFQAVGNSSISKDQTLLLFDKERVFDSRKKWKYKPYDLYTFTNTIQAFIYRYTLQNKDTAALESFLASFLIFIGFFTEDSEQLSNDMHYLDKAHNPSEAGNTNKNNKVDIPEKLIVDYFFSNSYFFKSSRIRGNIGGLLQSCRSICEPYDFGVLEKEFEKIQELLANPFYLTRKWGNYQTRFTIQPVDSFVQREDITEFFEMYQIRMVSVLDDKLPYLPDTQKDKQLRTIQKRKDISLDQGEKVCIISPSKKASQQLILSLHKSDVYQGYFLAAEQVTGGSGKIIQQTSGKERYILIGSYNFCIQCVANGIKFDSIGALDIISSEYINPFTDLSYYALHEL